MAPDTGPPKAAGLQDLRARIERDLDILAYPFKPWCETPARPGHFDVVIVGAGQSGVAIAAGLKRERVENILVVDKAPYGQEGPWVTYARMPTLRSPKYLTGPDWGVPSLTFRAWYEARFGAEAWDRLDKIPTDMWRDFLLWLREVLDLPVRNDCRLARLSPEGDGFRLTLEEGGSDRTVSATKVVLCTGIEGAGSWHIPSVVRDGLSSGRYDHASNPDIDFSAFQGRTLAVQGAGASAFDQAATALEAGAAEVLLFTRRRELHRVQPYKHLEKSGFLRGHAALSDAWRWRFMDYLLTLREPPPRETVERTTRHPNFRLVVDAPWTHVAETDGRISIDTPKGGFAADHILCGTGFEVDLAARPELAGLHPAIARWADRFTAPVGEENEALSAYPYLGPGFEFLERDAGTMPCLKNLHLFTFGSTLSQGFSGGGMNGLKYALPRLLDGIVCGLFAGDIERHYRELLDYDVPEFETDGLPTV